MKKILIVFGTRPEAIKMAPLVKRFENYKEYFNVKVCVTAQHREMLDQVLDIFEIEPDYDLNIMKKEQDLYDISSNVLLGIKEVLKSFSPELVLVHGDTTTTSMTTLASYYQKIKIGHVEAGLRTNNLYSPWPEEGNRLLVGSLATFHFAPTEESKKNLLLENKEEKNILVCGNSVIDALFSVLEKIKNDSEKKKNIIDNILLKFDKKINIEKSKFILVTGHRRENFGNSFTNICNALKKIALNNPDIDIIYPVHLNPNVRIPVNKILNNIKNIYLIEPLEYESFIYLMNNSYFIITDSGGVQEEAPSLGKPVLVIRNTTERPEALQAGTVKLVGTSQEKIITESEKLINNSDYYNSMSKAKNPYGEGKTSKKIIEFLRERL